MHRRAALTRLAEYRQWWQGVADTITEEDAARVLQLDRRGTMTMQAPSRKQAFHSSAERPTPLPITPELLPKELKNLDQWCVWKYFRPDATRPWGKLPIDAKNGRPAKSNDPSTCCSFEIALLRYQTNESGDLAGLMFAPDSGRTLCRP